LRTPRTRQHPYDEEESGCDWQRNGWSQVFAVHD
jgi:hypothetical protein